jgi:dihydrofolate reductase
MRIIIIAAMTKDRVIGKDGRVPWHEPEDLRHFKRTTTGHAIVMGRKTFESIGRPLPGRRNIVITSNPAYRLPESSPAAGEPSTANRPSPIVTVGSLDEALELCRGRNEEKAFIVGGGQIHGQAMGIADEMILTHIDGDDIAGDTYFPAWNDDDWSRVSETRAGAIRIVTLHRAGG